MERFGRSKTNSERMLSKKYEEGLVSKAGQMSCLEKSSRHVFKKSACTAIKVNLHKVRYDFLSRTTIRSGSWLDERIKA